LKGGLEFHKSQESFKNAILYFSTFHVYIACEAKDCIKNVYYNKFTNIHRQNLAYTVLLLSKTTDLSQVTDKFNSIMLHRVHLAMNGVQTLNCCGDSH
jgi:hypothetical protein